MVALLGCGRLPPAFVLTGFLFQGPCQRELYRVLEQLTKARQEAGEEIYKFYLPNCNKNGFFHSKQVGGLVDR